MDLFSIFVNNDDDDDDDDVTLFGQSTDRKIYFTKTNEYSSDI